VKQTIEPALQPQQADRARAVQLKLSSSCAALPFPKRPVAASFSWRTMLHPGPPVQRAGGARRRLLCTQMRDFAQRQPAYSRLNNILESTEPLRSMEYPEGSWVFDEISFRSPLLSFFFCLFRICLSADAWQHTVRMPLQV